MVVIPAGVEERVVAMVAGLVVDLGGPGAARRIALDDSLERDLGIGSLERVELFVRLEKELGAVLGERAMAEAETVRDLVQAALAAPGTAPEPARTAPASRAPALTVPTPAQSLPTQARSLVDVLAIHAARRGDRAHAIFPDVGGQERHVTYGELWERARAIAGGLRARGLRPGDRVGLMLPTGEDFLASFFGALVAAAVPVPLYPPFRRAHLVEYAQRQSGILANAEARWLIAFDAAIGMAGILRARVPSLTAVVTVADLVGSGLPDAAPALAGHDPALIQYTSGSTGDPKGVLLCHANVLANIRAIGEAIAHRPGRRRRELASALSRHGPDRLVAGRALLRHPHRILLSPLAFLARPARWLQAIDRVSRHGIAGAQLRLRPLRAQDPPTRRSPASTCRAGGSRSTGRSR